MRVRFVRDLRVLCPLSVSLIRFLSRERNHPSSEIFFGKIKGKEINFFPTLDLKISQIPPRNLQIFNPIESTLCVLQLSFFE